MSFEGLVPAEFFTFEGRLASFKQSFPQPKRRASGAGKGASKNLTWPHAKYLLPEDLAKAGFVWRPFPENPDNVACFLCNKSLDGWEEGDNALEEHIKHAPNCGWAIVAGIEANVGDLASEDPSSTRMINARKETFGGRWPHDGKRGWKCKTKQLAEAGWKYTPSLEYDDMATCTYCDLALDGWEQGDKPWDEHNNRSPECPFFALVEQYGTTKKPKAKAARGSKTTARLSVQSVATAASDITTLTDAPAEVDDSVLTTASMPGKKGSRAKKATTTAKGRKTKAKKDEPVEVVESEPMEAEEPAPPPKPARGRKRTSDEADESAMTVSEAPAPKKRAPRSRKAAADSSVIDQSQQDISIADAPAPAKAPKGRKTARASGTKGTRKASGQSLKSTASTASLRAAPGAFPEDDEIQRQLEADLERPLTDDEDIMQDSDSERQKLPAPKPKTKKAHVPQDQAASPERADSQMFDAEPYVADEAAVDEELKQLEAEMTIDEPEVLEVPKKGRKAAGPRKVSKQTKAQKAKAAPVPVEEDELSMAVEPEAPVEPAQPEEPVDPEEDEISTATVITTTTKNARMSTSSRTSTGSTGRKRGRPSKKSLELRASLEASKTEEVDMVEPEMAEPEAEPEPIAEPEVEPEEVAEAEEVVEPEPEVESEAEMEPEAEVEAEEVPEQDEEEADEVDEVSARQSFASARQTPAPAEPQEDEAEDEDEPQVEREEEEQGEEEEEEPESEAPEPTPQPKQQPKKKSIPPASSSPVVAAPSTRRSLQQQTAAPRISPAQSARQPAVSPSPSPQSSDAENQPPSSRSATAKKRVMQAPSSTPARPNSPTKRKVLASLQSTTPWNPVDIDLIFGSPEKSDKRNAVDRLLHKGMELTSPEKRMTVEEWIHFNANQAEERLRQECEAMVSKFENEGTKAMNVLEGLVAE